MTVMSARSESKVSKWGWILLLILAAFLVLNGVTWFFMGGSLTTFEVDTGVPLNEFKEVYPTVAKHIAVNARQVAIWFVAVGLLAITVAWQGFRHGARWAWNAMWILVAAPAAVGLNVLAGGETDYGTILMGLTVLGLVGQLLAYQGRAA